MAHRCVSRTGNTHTRLRLTVATAVIGGLLLAGCSDDTEPPEARTKAEGSGSTPSASAAPSPSATPLHERVSRTSAAIEVPAPVRKAVRQGTDGYLDATTAVLGNPEQGVASVKEHVRGKALASLLALRAEYADKEYTVRGKPRILSQRIVERDQDPPRMVVLACVDDSSVRVLDAQGEELDTGASDPSLNIVTLTRVGQRWVVSDVTFPNEPEC